MLVRRQDAIDCAHIGCEEEILPGIAVEFLFCFGEQRTPVEWVLDDWTVAEKVVERRSNVGQGGGASVIVDEVFAHLRRKMNDERHAHDFRPDGSGMARAAELSGGVAVVARDDDDAVVVHSALFEITKKLSQTSIDPMHFIRDADAHAFGSLPVLRSRRRNIIARELVDVLGLIVEKNRLL